MLFIGRSFPHCMAFNAISVTNCVIPLRRQWRRKWRPSFRRRRKLLAAVDRQSSNCGDDYQRLAQFCGWTHFAGEKIVYAEFILQDHMFAGEHILRVNNTFARDWFCNAQHSARKSQSGRRILRVSKTATLHSLLLLNALMDLQFIHDHFWSTYTQAIDVFVVAQFCRKWQSNWF